jgi:hypothetical protein
MRQGMPVAADKILRGSEIKLEPPLPLSKRDLRLAKKE